MIEPREQQQSASAISPLASGRKIVLDRLSLDVNRGEILGLVGASGGGNRSCCEQSSV